MSARPCTPLSLGFAILAALFSLQGCQPVLSNSPATTQSESRPDNTVANWPFKYQMHDFGAACYSTYGCKIKYDNFLHVDEPDDELQPSSESIGPDYLEYLDGSYLGIKNFPPPAEISWRSKDGQPHHAVIDIGEIFKDQLIRHNVPKDDIPENVSIGHPSIIIEVNDRTVNVYMKGWIPTKSLRTPGNPNSDYRNEAILAYSKTY